MFLQPQALNVILCAQLPNRRGFGVGVTAWTTANGSTLNGPGGTARRRGRPGALPCQQREAERAPHNTVQTSPPRLSHRGAQQPQTPGMQLSADAAGTAGARPGPAAPAACRRQKRRGRRPAAHARGPVVAAGWPPLSAGPIGISRDSGFSRCFAGALRVFPPLSVAGAGSGRGAGRSRARSSASGRR